MDLCSMRLFRWGEGTYKLGAYFPIFGILRRLKIKSYSESMKIDLRGWIFIKQNLQNAEVWGEVDWQLTRS